MAALAAERSIIRDYHREWITLDVAAGLTAAAVVMPKAMAYATIAGLPVQVGLYTVLIPMVIYAALGTSRPLSVSTTATLAVLTAAALGRDGMFFNLEQAGRRFRAIAALLLLDATAHA